MVLVKAGLGLGYRGKLAVLVSCCSGGGEDLWSLALEKMQLLILDLPNCLALNTCPSLTEQAEVSG